MTSTTTTTNTDPKDIFNALSDEQMDKIWLVVAPPNPNSKNQKHRFIIIPPDEQHPNPSPEALKKMTDVTALAKPGCLYPKLSIILPPMILRSKMSKIAGPGSNVNANADGKECDMSNHKHSFWLVASTDGVPEKILAQFGGAEKLKQDQEHALDLLKKSTIAFERKRFFHPALCDMDPESQRALLSRYEKFKKDITLKEALENEFESLIMDHNKCKIMANLKAFKNAIGPPGVALTSKAWYRKRDSVSSPEEIEKRIDEYKESARMNRFTVNKDIITGLRQGLHHRRVDVFVKNHGQCMIAKGPADPMKLHARGGDFIQCKVSYKLYDNGSMGGSWELERIKLIHQATNSQNQTIEMGSEMAESDDFVDRYAPIEQQQEPDRKRQKQNANWESQQEESDKSQITTEQIF